MTVSGKKAKYFARISCVLEWIELRVFLNVHAELFYREFPVVALKDQITKLRDKAVERKQEYLRLDEKAAGYTKSFSSGSDRLGEEISSLWSLQCRLPQEISPVGLRRIMAESNCRLLTRRVLMRALVSSD